MNVMMVILLIVCLCVCLISFMLLRSMQEKLAALQKSDKMKSFVIRALNREIRTPLHSVSGLAEIISKDDLYLSKEEKKNITDQIQYNTNMIATLLDEVTMYSDESRGGHQIQNERLNPNLLCQRCLDANRNYAQKGVKMVFRHELSDSFFFSSDRHIVELVLNKLVFNSCRFTKEGEISIGCRHREGERQMMFYVQDTGGGIPQDRKAYLYSWFDQPEEMSDYTEFDLSAAQRLAAKVGGYLKLDELYQEGTRMEFILPVR